MISLFFLIFSIISALNRDNLVINEVYIGERIEWVELYNNSSNPVNLEGYIIANSMKGDTISGIIEPYSFFLISSSSIFPQSLSYTTRDRKIGSGLKRDADAVLLFDNKGNLLDFVNWGTASPSWKYYRKDFWNSLPGGYRDYARIPNGVDSDSPADWAFGDISTPMRRNEIITGLDPSSWDRIKSLFSEEKK